MKIRYVIAIQLMRWLANFYDFSFNWKASAKIGIHPTKAWLSQLVNFKNEIWTWGHFRRTICNKILTIWPRWATRQFLTVPIVQSLLFPKLRGCRYETIEEMKEAVTKVSDTLTQEDFDGAFQKSWERYNKCIATGGRLLRRGLESHVCTINKSAHTKKVWKHI